MSDSRRKLHDDDSGHRFSCSDRFIRSRTIPADDLKNELTVLIAKLDKENQRLLEYLAVEQSLQEKQRQMPPIDFDNLHTLLKNNYNAGLNTRYTEFLNEIFGHEATANSSTPT